MKNAYSYVRFSSKPQEMGRSKARQEEATQAFCQRHGLKLSPHNFHDLGISAWKGKNFHEGALGAFLQGVQSGRIPQSSILIVESLDRISRQVARKAIRIVESIIEAGAVVATINPERLYDLKAIDDPFSLMEMLFVFVRANEESEMKSKRIKDAWRKRREKGLVKGGRGPAWLDFVDGKWKPIKTKVESVKAIIRLCADGYGAPSILQYLHDNKLPNPATDKPKWSLAYVQLLMSDRRLIGELQPCELVDGKRKSTGMPIPDFYPAVVDVGLFARAQAAIATRKRTTTTKHGNTINLFGGLLVEPASGSKWIVGKKAANKPARLQLLSARNRECKSLSADYDEVEKAVLSYLADLDLDTLLPRDDVADTLRGKLADVIQRIAAISAQIENEDPDDVQPLAALLVRLEKERKQLAAAQNQNAAQQHAAGSAQGVIDRMQKAEGADRQRLRIQLRTHLASVIEKIELQVVPYWKWSIGMLDIYLTNGSVRREVTHKDVLPKEKRNELLLNGDRYPNAAVPVEMLAELPPADRVQHDRQRGVTTVTLTSRQHAIPNGRRNG